MRKPCVASCLVVVVVVLMMSAGVGRADEAKKPGRITFGKKQIGQVPAGWKVEQTGEAKGKGKGSAWQVVADATAPGGTSAALAQVGTSPGSVFNLCVLVGGGEASRAPKLADVELEVSFKAVKGTYDQGGGLVWRYQDAKNYYVARFNPLEDNYRLYKVVAGKRIQLATREKLTVQAGTWHTLKVRMVGEKIECSLDGKKALEATDGAIKQAGLVGLWTKADAQTWFDNLRVATAAAAGAK